MIEPEEGAFTFDLVDQLVMQARERGGHLGILWFGAWKNSQCMYAPEWVKLDHRRFKRAQMQKGKECIILEMFHGQTYTTLSYLCEETRVADGKAFAELLKHLKEIDGETHTVVYVQVENETGVMGAAREHSDEADALFAGQAPQGLIDYLKANTEEMDPGLKKDVENGAASGTWEEAFGDSAEEVFSVYYTASYCNYIAQQGQAEYALPMAVNAWLRQGPTGSYPTGGPIYQMMEVWQYAAPQIGVLCPDIYVKNFLEICDGFTKRGNPLFIPETAPNGHVGARLVYSVGHYHAACFAPFGFEDMGVDVFNPLVAIFGGDASDPLLNEMQDVGEYKYLCDTISSMIPKLTDAYGTKRLQAAISERQEELTLKFGDLALSIMTQVPLIERQDGALLVLEEAGSAGDDAETAENEGSAVSKPHTFYILINRAFLQISSLDEKRPNVEVLSLDEGVFEDGEWKTTLHRNGDEVQLMLFRKPALLRLKVYNY